MQMRVTERRLVRVLQVGRREREREQVVFSRNEDTDRASNSPTPLLPLPETSDANIFIESRERARERENVSPEGTSHQLSCCYGLHITAQADCVNYYLRVEGITKHLHVPKVGRSVFSSFFSLKARVNEPHLCSC